jgi:hypothetical protein
MQLKFWLTALLFGLTVSAFGQTTSKVEVKSLKTYFDGNYAGQKQFFLPAEIGIFLPKVLLIKRKKPALQLKAENLSSFIKATRFLYASEYSTNQISDRLWFPSIEYRGKIYAFAGEHFDVEADAKIFNSFLMESGLKVENEREASELATLYLTITRGYLENGGRLILQSVEDVPLSYRKDKEGETNRLGKIVVALKTASLSDSFDVELFTWEMALGKVNKWIFKIKTNGQIEVHTQTIGKL